jgi:hypothetical protein
MSDLVRRPDSDVKRAELLLRITLDRLLRYQAGRKEEATREALVKLRPHVEAALEALETLGRMRGLDDEMIVKRGAFMMLLDLAEQPADRQPPQGI